MLAERELLSQIDDVRKGITHQRGVAQPVHQRERGMWSFLTWSFFLSQLVSSGVFFSGSAKADDDALPASPLSGDEKAAGSNLLEGLQHSSFSEGGEAGSEPVIAAGDIREAIAVSEARVAGVEAQELTLDPGGSCENGSEAAGEPAFLGSGTAAPGSDDAQHGDDGQGSDDVAEGPQDGGADQPGGPIIDLPGVIGPIVDDVVVPILNPVVDLVETVVDGVVVPVVAPVVDIAEAVVDGVIVPVVATVGEFVGDLVVPVVEPVVGLAEAVIDGAVTPILSPAGELIDAAVDTLLSPIAAPIGGIVEAVAGGIVAPIMTPAGQLAEAISAEVVTPVLQPVGDLVETVFDAVDPVLEPIGTIVKAAVDEVVSPALDPLADLFQTTFDGVVNPVAGSAIDAVTTVADVVTGPVLAPAVVPVEAILGATEAAAEPAVDQGAAIVEIAKPVSDTLAPALEPVGEIIDATPIGNLPVLGSLTGLLGVNGVASDSVASGGELSFPDTQVTNGNDLFANGSYTEYNMALQDNAAGAEAESAGTSTSGAIQNDLIIGVDSADPQDAGDDGGVAALSKLVGSFGLHTLGDGLFS